MLNLPKSSDCIDLRRQKKETIRNKTRKETKCSDQEEKEKGKENKFVYTTIAARHLVSARRGKRYGRTDGRTQPLIESWLMTKNIYEMVCSRYERARKQEVEK